VPLQLYINTEYSDVNPDGSIEKQKDRRRDLMKAGVWAKRTGANAPSIAKTATEGKDSLQVLESFFGKRPTSPESSRFLNSRILVCNECRLCENSRAVLGFPATGGY
jgi:hypothetical protein